jgi:hypothetical protein
VGFERVTLFGTVEILYQSSLGAVLSLWTDLPGDALVLRRFGTMPAAAGRRTFRLRVSGAVKGRLYQLMVTPSNGGDVRIYGARVWARQLGPAASAWQWYAVPVVETPDEYQPVKLPIEPTGDAWQAVKLPVEPTPEDWSAAALPIKATPPVPEWVSVEVDE